MTEEADSTPPPDKKARIFLKEVFFQASRLIMEHYEAGERETKRAHNIAAKRNQESTIYTTRKTLFRNAMELKDLDIDTISLTDYFREPGRCFYLPVALAVALRYAEVVFHLDPSLSEEEEKGPTSKKAFGKLLQDLESARRVYTAILTRDAPKYFAYLETRHQGSGEKTGINMWHLRTGAIQLTHVLEKRGVKPVPPDLVLNRTISRAFYAGLGKSEVFPEGPGESRTR